MGIEFELNGANIVLELPATHRLSDALREHAQCRDVKVGCNAGDCGLCTVLLNGDAVCACLVPIGQVAGKRIDTLSGLMQTEAVTQRLANSFLMHGAAQCGICTPGLLVAATPLLRENKTPCEQAAKDALGGVLCRCTGYRKILAAVCNTEALTTNNNARVGGSPMRVDGYPKVTGAEQFADDVAPENALVLKVIRSPYHRASFSFGDIDAFVANTEGVHAVFTHNDIPGVNQFGVIPPFFDQPVFAESECRFKGEPVAAVVGDAGVMHAFNPDSFPVSFNALEAVLTPEEAMQPTVKRLHENSEHNVMCEGFVQCGDAKSALKAASHTATVHIETGFVEHAYLEPEAGYAIRQGNRISLYGCTQAPYMNRDSIASILGIDAKDVQMVSTATGGGFGSKLDISWQPLVALAAWHLKQPVRVTFSRRESMQSTTKRHPASIQVQFGCDEHGKVTAAHFDGVFNTGAYASWGPTVANRVPIHASGPYRIAHYRARTQAVYTHCAPSGAFRGFGVPQAAIAQEIAFDDLANQVGMDRLAFRLHNALRNGEPTITGQVFDGAVGISECLNALEKAWTDANKRATLANKNAIAEHSHQRFGVGIASGWYGCGNTSLPNPSTIKAGVNADGVVCLHQGAVDIGQGANTVIAQIFSDACGVDLADIRLISSDTDITPDAGKTSASRQTFVSGNAAKLAGAALRKKMLRLGNTPSWSDLPVDDDGYVVQVSETYDPPTLPLDENGQGVPYAVYGYAAQLAELCVDIETGQVTLLNFVAAHDVGKAINPVLIEGQIQGGVAQGIGLALMESFIPGRTENLHDYLIPTIGDIPPIESILVEVADPHGPFGAKGLGEHVLIPTAPAILNAIYHASGARVTNLPATPDKVLAAISKDT